MTDEKNSFVVYTDIKETLDELTDEQVAALFRGMVNYQLTGVDPNFSGTLKFAFIPIRQQMDRDNTKWEQVKQKRAASGRQGGIRSGEVRREKAEANEAIASSKLTDNIINEANEANEAVNVNVNVNVNGNVNDNVADAESLSSSLISYLNEKSGGKYKPTAAITDRIGELLAAGYTERDFYQVIDSKVAEWKDDPKMRSYLRPRTLFGDKFEEYVSGPVPVEVEEQQKKEETRAKLIEERKGLAAALSILTANIQTLRDSPGGIKQNWAHYRTLADEKAIAEQKLENIDKRLGRLAT